jgi:hypothetical protein
MVVAVLAATASAAFFARNDVRRLMEDRGAVARKSSSAATLATTIPVRPVPPATFTVQGEVTNSGATSGTLTLRVGSQVSTAPITIAPQYSFEIPAAQGTDMVSVEIVTPTYKFASLLGSYAKLVRHAGTDGTLTIAEFDRTRVSPLSTALYFFIQRELGGRLPASDSEHEQVIRSLLGDDITGGAWALQDLAEGVAPLPPAYANGYELLQDQTAYLAYRYQYGRGYPTPYYLMSAPSIPIRPEQLGINTLLQGAIPSRDVAMLDPGVQIISQGPQGWTSNGYHSRRNALFAPQILPSGDLELSPQGDVYSEHMVAKYFDPTQVTPQQVRERHTILRETYRQIFVGERYSLWGMQIQYVRTYPDYPAQPPIVITDTWMRTASKIDGLLPFRDGELVGQRALPAFCKQGSPALLSNCEFALQRFSANGTGASENVGAKVDSLLQPVSPVGGALFTWTSGRRGPLTLTYFDTAATYWRIDRGNEAVDVLVYIARAQDGDDTLTLAGQTPLINADLPGDFADFSPVGTWRYANFEQVDRPYGYEPDYGPVLTRFFRSADGTTMRSDTYNYESAPVGSEPDEVRSIYGWQLLDGRLYESTYRANATNGIYNSSGFPNCQAAYARGATRCAPSAVRYFMPLARVGNRLYGIQEINHQPSFSYTPPFVVARSSIPNYYEKL